MTVLHAFVMSGLSFAAGAASAIVYTRYGLGWVSAVEAEVKADLARIVAIIEYRTGGALPLTPPVQQPPVAYNPPPPAAAPSSG